MRQPSELMQRINLGWYVSVWVVTWTGNTGCLFIYVAMYSQCNINYRSSLCQLFTLKWTWLLLWLHHVYSSGASCEIYMYRMAVTKIHNPELHMILFAQNINVDVSCNLKMSPLSIETADVVPEPISSLILSCFYNFKHSSTKKHDIRITFYFTFHMHR